MIPNDFYYFVISGFVLMALPIGLIAWFQAGFFLKWLNVRASRGKLTLVKVRGKLRDWWDKGEIKGDFLIYGKKQNKKRIRVSDNVVYRCFGVTVVDADEASNALAKTDFTPVSGFDAEKFEDLYTRALYRPTLAETDNRLLVILLIVIIAAVVINAFLTFQTLTAMEAMQAATITTVV